MKASQPQSYTKCQTISKQKFSIHLLVFNFKILSCLTLFDKFRLTHQSNSSILNSFQILAQFKK